MKRNTAFRLSRIQAEGWKAARGLPLVRPENFNAAKIDAINPYPTAPERRRWAEGFASALAADLVSTFRP